MSKSFKLGDYGVANERMVSFVTPPGKGRGGGGLGIPWLGQSAEPKKTVEPRLEM
jgi:hypothetical protein